MITTLAWRPGDQPWQARSARGLLVALNAPFIAIAPFEIIVGVDHSSASSPLIVVPLGLVLGALQLWHSLAAAQGQRPSYWKWTLLALAVVVYLPMFWIGRDWAAAQILLSASAWMFLHGWRRTSLIAAVVLGNAAAQLILGISVHATQAQNAYDVIYTMVVFVLFPAALYGAVRLVVVGGELYSARTGLAASAVGQERLRVSRDLHDLLGQSLSAISLKGDLALRLLPSDSARARKEIEGLTEVARGALHDMTAITRGEHHVSFRDEIHAAAGFLSAAGIEVSIEAGSADPPAHAQEVLAWAVREGTTNVLRHSDARACAITVRTDGGAAWLEMVNDSARQASATDLVHGSGLAGLAGRAEALHGTARAQADADGTFRLRVWLPDQGDAARG
jgi:two-component system, NarL family, sensor histidine kinase DesK